MLSAVVDWEERRKDFTYIESDSIAVIRNGTNSLQFVPVFLNAATSEAFIRDNGWVPVREVRGLERFEKVQIPTETLYDPLAQRVYEVPKYA